MSRGDCSDMDEFPGQLELYRANTDRAISGKRGQKFLRELRDALLILPQKRLIVADFSNGGEVCALGALAVKRRLDEGKTRDDALEEVAHEFNEQETEYVASGLGTCFNLAWEIMYLNDDPDRFGRMTQEERYNAMLGWVESALKGVREQ